MTMNKFGVSSEVLHQELREEESSLMQQMQRLMGQPTEKTAGDRSRVEFRLQAVRQKLTELDTKKGE